ncbi:MULTISPECIES: L,D-transpeptidase [Legionella]|uniref:L,D-transpeptidase n=1 Tax=Legionella resiliens TaxID=2905958 RepID=A0ABS8X0C7_9GAMM|nr:MULTISPECIES: L,D-transpeptidase [unclassified Legionella]MCE0723035.1 L,D-transpeptidase [Legionella sp. 9fVS26]MCE3532188.1 L,D-transpeptidase [Legionella sp. 8cVS16]QLZ68315.1 enhanced entry protein EnhA [Legionella sp. PC1000]
MNKLFWAGLLLCVGGLTSCVENDPSTLITDDAGYVHRTVHYTKDKRGRDYYPQKIQATGEKRFIFDPNVSAWAAYDEEGNRLLTGGGSAGIDVCEENSNQSCRTVTGTFKVYNRRGVDCKSGEYPVDTKGGAKMPYCTYFYQGYTIHAAYEVPEHPSSHGCVRIFPSAAKWLSENFFQIGTKVIVLEYPSEPGANKPAVKSA